MLGTGSSKTSNHSEPIRILVVDDHAIVRRGLRDLLATFPDMEVVGEAGDGSSALSAAASLSPDIIILDVFLGSTDGLDLVPQLRRAAPPSRIVILTASDRDEDFASARASHIHAYVLKSGSEEYLAKTIREVYRGKHFMISVSTATDLDTSQNGRDIPSYFAWNLTDKQKQALRLRARGLSNKQIGRELHVTDRAVRHRLSNIMRLLGVDSPKQAIEVALKRRII